MQLRDEVEQEDIDRLRSKKCAKGFSTVIAHLEAWFQTVQSLATILSGIGSILVGLTVWYQVRGIQNQSLLYLHQYLSQTEIMGARRKVRKELYQKGYLTWDENDKDLANQICTSYDQAGLLVLNHNMGKKVQNLFLYSSWGESICDQYEALGAYLNQYHTPQKLGWQFFKHFDQLYKEARKVHRKSSQNQSLKIISGGQSGIDRAALDVAIVLGLPYGGWCPRGGLAEDMPNPPGLLHHYEKMLATQSKEYEIRTRLNVENSGATLILVNKPDQENIGGTGTTKKICEELNRPFKVVSLNEPDSVNIISAWLSDLPKIGELNIAGPRESDAPGSYGAARMLLREVLTPLSVKA